jgi:hypothetical protein
MLRSEASFRFLPLSSGQKKDAGPEIQESSALEEQFTNATTSHEFSTNMSTTDSSSLKSQGRGLRSQVYRVSDRPKAHNSRPLLGFLHSPDIDKPEKIE